MTPGATAPFHFKWAFASTLNPSNSVDVKKLPWLVK